MIGPDVLQLLMMDCDRQQPASLQRERLVNCNSLSQGFPGRTRNTEPSQKENMADVGNREKQQAATRLPLLGASPSLASSWIFLQKAKKKPLYSTWFQQRCFSLNCYFFKLRRCCRSSEAGSAQTSTLILALSLIASRSV